MNYALNYLTNLRDHAGQGCALHSVPVTPTSSQPISGLSIDIGALSLALSSPMPKEVEPGQAYQISLSANCISRAVVVVEVSKPATPVGAPVESKISVWSGVTGTAKFARFNILKNSTRNWTLKFSENLLM